MKINFMNTAKYNSSASMVKDKKNQFGYEMVTTVGEIEGIQTETIDCIKIDVEEAELNVLRAIESIIEQHHPFLIVESLSDRAELDIKRFLGNLGYSFDLDGRNILCYHRST